MENYRSSILSRKKKRRNNMKSLWIETTKNELKLVPLEKDEEREAFNNKFVIMYAGGLYEKYGLKIYSLQ